MMILIADVLEFLSKWGPLAGVLLFLLFEWAWKLDSVVRARKMNRMIEQNADEIKDIKRIVSALTLPTPSKNGKH